jgi:hypothetical protein
MTTTEQAIAELHQWYCGRTGLQTKLCFSQRLWYDLSKYYGFDFRRLRADAELIVRYLKREIARDKRNLGALKLSNFLQPDNFDADLAIARLAMKRPRTTDAKETTTKLDCVGVETRADDQTRGKIAEQLRSFRKSLGSQASQ